MVKLKEYFKDWVLGEIIWLIVAPLVIMGLSFYWKDTAMGVVSAVTGVLCVILTAKGKLSAYLFGTINTVLYAIIAYQAKYYGDFMLNAFYFLPFQFIGYWQWKKHMGDNKHLEMLKMSVKQLLIWAGVWIVAIAGYGTWLKHLGGSLPYVDATSTVLSVWAMYISVKRYTEQWIAWIVIDVVTIIMWVFAFIEGGDNIATLTMWVIYLLNAVYGYLNWKRHSKKQGV